MAFVKLVKSTAYFKRYQTKYRRRKEGKTDYYARKRLITQDKDKYNTPKYRLVVRKTCSKVLAQITYATLKGDKVLCQATSSELKKYGLTAGLTNYAASYATGLLIARRLLNKLEMDTIYKGVQKIDGADYQIDNEEADRRPFTAVLDIGLAYTTTGARVFGALKGAIDGGLKIPFSENRFPGYTKPEDDEPANYDPKAHRERIFGVHVDKYMAELKKEKEAYNKQFSKWDACLKSANAKSVEELFTKIHAEIRKNPAFKKVAVKKIEHSERKYTLPAKRLTLKQRKDRIKNKIKKLQKEAKK